MKKVLALILALCMVLAMAACGNDAQTPEPTKAEVKTTEAAGTPAETPAEAPAEKAPEDYTGKLVIYSPNSDTQVETTLTNGFMVKYPNIEVEFQKMGTGDVLSRIEAEKDNPIADINWGAVNYSYYYQHPDLWEAYVSPLDANLDEAYQNNTGYVTYGNLSGSGCFILNNDLLAELGVEVKGYADLLNPKLKGKIAMGDPTASSSAFAELTNMLLVMGKGETAAECYQSEEAWQYVKDFVANLDGTIISSSSHVYKDVIAGEYAVGVSYEDPVVQAVIDNAENPDANISLVYPSEGAVWLPAGAAIVKNAPNMENAKLFIDYLISEEAQVALAATSIRGTITSIPQTCEGMLPMSEIKVVYEDQAAVVEQKDAMIEKWTEILIG